MPETKSLTLRIQAGCWIWLVVRHLYFIKNGKLQGNRNRNLQDHCNQKDWKYTFQEFSTVEDRLHALNKQRIDSCSGPISIIPSKAIGTTLRFFTQPLQFSLAIVSRPKQMSFMEKE